MVGVKKTETAQQRADRLMRLKHIKDAAAWCRGEIEVNLPFMSGSGAITSICPHPHDRFFVWENDCDLGVIGEKEMKLLEQLRKKYFHDG